MSIERKKETIEVWNICECGKLLLSVSEAKRGTCASCWFQTLGEKTKKALNKVVSMAFTPTTEEEREEAIGKALEQLEEESKK
jgi:hypothetical protein